jgi:hypothetical protein
LSTGQAYAWRVYVKLPNGALGISLPRTVTFTQ